MLRLYIDLCKTEHWSFRSAMKSQSRNLKLNEVITITEEDTLFVCHETFRVSEFICGMQEHLETSYPLSKNKVTRWGEEGVEYEIVTPMSEDKIVRWTEEGVECEILSPNKSWQKGRIKISLEFIPDEIEPEDSMSNGKVESDVSESPLDDVRQMM